MGGMEWDGGQFYAPSYNARIGIDGHIDRRTTDPLLSLLWIVLGWVDSVDIIN